jgi:hypothetical protein
MATLRRVDEDELETWLTLRKRRKATHGLANSGEEHNRPARGEHRLEKLLWRFAKVAKASLSASSSTRLFDRATKQRAEMITVVVGRELDRYR